MKSISFDAESVAAILRGEKTVTRRLANGPCRYRVGETLYVSERWRMPEKDARLFVEIVSVARGPLDYLDVWECYAEGMSRTRYTLTCDEWWRDRWNDIHDEPGTRFEDHPVVDRIEFVVRHCPTEVNP